MRARLLVAGASWFALAASSLAVDLRQRTDSGQFTIFCEDVALRRQVASLAVRTRDELSALLPETEGHLRPIVVSLDATPAPGPQPLATFRVVESDVGLKIEIAARLGNNPAAVNLQRQLVHALLVEYMYRAGGLPEGKSFTEPPWWVMEGGLELLRSRNLPPEGEFFRRLIETNRLPPLENFLTQKPDELGPTALAVDRALAMCLVQLLLDQPDGRRHLGNLLRGWPSANGDPLAALGKEFSGLNGGAAALQKWWTLSLAHLAAADQFQGLSADQSDRELRGLLRLDIPGKDGSTGHFALTDFPEFLKLPASRGVLAARRYALVALSARANVLLRPVIGEYAEVLGLLERGKTNGAAVRLSKVERLYASIIRRADEIADYLNWYEATQMHTRSNAFDEYLKAANDLKLEDRESRTAVGRYLDQLERAY